MTSFSPGLAQGCFDLLEMAGRRVLPFGNISVEFSKLGSMPASKVVETAQTLNWLRASDDGRAVVTPSGERIVAAGCYELRLRQALLDYIDVVRPSWIQNATFGRARVLFFAGSEICQVFIEAGLAHGTNKNVVSFWDEMAARARGQKASRLSDIGRDGERLTLNHERERTGIEPQWIAIDSNEDGYDILSIAGPSDPRLLLIEVKATTVGMRGIFHLTANEWDRAVCNELHLFHLWDMSSTTPSLAVLTKEDVESHIPANRGKGEWETVQVPFDLFESKFILSLSRT